MILLGSQKLLRHYLHSAAGVLVITAISKFVFVTTARLSVVDQYNAVVPLLTNGQLLVLAGVLEIFVAASVFRANEAFPKAAALAWIGTLFLTYRVALEWMVPDASCACLGITLGLLSRLTDNGINVERVLTGILLAYICAGPYWIIAKQLLIQSPRKASELRNSESY